MKPQDNTLSLILRRIRPVLVGLCVGVLSIALLLLLAALVIRSVDVPHAAVTPLAYGAAGLGAFAAGLTAALLSRRNGLLTGAVCGVVLYLILLLAGSLLPADGAGPALWIKPLLLLAMGALGGVLGVNRKKR